MAQRAPIDVVELSDEEDLAVTATTRKAAASTRPTTVAATTAPTSVHCAACWRPVASIQELEVHVTVDHLRWAPYKCHVCASTWLPTEHLLRGHLQAKHPTHPYKMVYVADDNNRRQLREIMEGSLRLSTLPMQQFGSQQFGTASHISQPPAHTVYPAARSAVATSPINVSDGPPSFVGEPLDSSTPVPPAPPVAVAAAAPPPAKKRRTATSAVDDEVVLLDDDDDTLAAEAAEPSPRRLRRRRRRQPDLPANESLDDAVHVVNADGRPNEMYVVIDEERSPVAPQSSAGGGVVCPSATVTISVAEQQRCAAVERRQARRAEAARLAKEHEQEQKRLEAERQAQLRRAEAERLERERRAREEEERLEKERRAREEAERQQRVEAARRQEEAAAAERAAQSQRAAEPLGQSGYCSLCNKTVRSGIHGHAVNHLPASDMPRCADCGKQTWKLARHVALEHPGVRIRRANVELSIVALKRALNRCFEEFASNGDAVLALIKDMLGYEDAATDSSKRQMQCTVCSDSVSSASTAADHVYYHLAKDSQIYRFVCSARKCSYGAESRHLVASHVKKQHRNQSTSVNAEDSIAKHFQTLFKKAFPLLNLERAKSVETAKTTEPLSSTMVEESNRAAAPTVRSAKRVTVHSDDPHSSDEEVENMPEADDSPTNAVNWCYLCSKSAGNKKNVHVGKHFPKRFQCSACDSSAKYSRNLQKHIRSSHTRGEARPIDTLCTADFDVLFKRCFEPPPVATPAKTIKRKSAPAAAAAAAPHTPVTRPRCSPQTREYVSPSQRRRPSPSKSRRRRMQPDCNLCGERPDDRFMHIYRCHLKEQIFECSECAFGSQFDRGDVKQHIVGVHPHVVGAEIIDKRSKFAGQFQRMIEQCFTNAPQPAAAADSRPPKPSSSKPDDGAATTEAKALNVDVSKPRARLRSSTLAQTAAPPPKQRLKRVIIDDESDGSDGDEQPAHKKQLLDALKLSRAAKRKSDAATPAEYRQQESSVAAPATVDAEPERGGDAATVDSPTLNQDNEITTAQNVVSVSTTGRSTSPDKEPDATATTDTEMLPTANSAEVNEPLNTAAEKEAAAAEDAVIDEDLSDEGNSTTAFNSPQAEDEALNEDHGSVGNHSALEADGTTGFAVANDSSAEQSQYFDDANQSILNRTEEFTPSDDGEFQSPPTAATAATDETECVSKESIKLSLDENSEQKLDNIESAQCKTLTNDALAESSGQLSASEQESYEAVTDFVESLISLVLESEQATNATTNNELELSTDLLPTDTQAKDEKSTDMAYDEPMEVEELKYGDELRGNMCEDAASFLSADGSEQTNMEDHAIVQTTLWHIVETVATVEGDAADHTSASFTAESELTESEQLESATEAEAPFQVVNQDPGKISQGDSEPAVNMAALSTVVNENVSPYNDNCSVEDHSTDVPVEEVAVAAEAQVVTEGQTTPIETLVAVSFALVDMIDSVVAEQSFQPPLLHTDSDLAAADVMHELLATLDDATTTDF